MIKDIARLETLLQSESLNDLNILPLDVPHNGTNSGEQAFAIEVDTHSALAMWSQLRKLVPKTGMWPVLYAFWGNPQNSWEEYVNNDNMFMRRPFEWESQEESRNLSPQAIVARAEITSFEGLLEKHADMYSENLQEDFGYSLLKTKERFGISPAADEVEHLIKCKKIKNYIEFEKWLLDWELQHIPREQSLPPASTRYIDWHIPQNVSQALILLPTVNCWEVLAYIHWYGAETCGSETAIAMLRWWNEKYGAELVAHYGTMLNIQVANRPATIDEAFRLAWEQEALAPCTTALPGESLRDHARALLKVHRWFLHERP